MRGTFQTVLIFLTGAILLCTATFSQGQQYLYPINPGQRSYLSGSMGELRGTHFHGGIDIKTGGAIGWSVYATADGYISRIKVSPVGYGNALYIYHPKYGTTSVYGHLDRYEERIADYVRKEQYKRKSFDLDISLTADAFPVQQGDLIAYGGNTGGSSGPHLHFEIRDAAQRPLNPLHYNFSEVKDNIPPIVQLFALRALRPDSRVENQFQTAQFTPYRSGNTYYYTRPIPVWGEIGVMMMGYDMMDGSSNKTGIPHLKLKVNGKEVSSIHVNAVPFDRNREIYVFRDYQLRREERKEFQKLYKEDGMTINIYENLVNRGILNIRDSLTYEVEIELEDAYRNQTKVLFTLVGQKPKDNISLSHHAFKPIKQEIAENTLFFMGKKDGDTGVLAEVYANRLKYEISPSYFVNNYGVYHWDLRKGLPDSVNLCHEIFYPKYDVMVPSGKEFSFFNNRMNLFFSQHSLFDTLYLKVDYADEWDDSKEFFIIGEDNVPLRRSVKVQLKPQKEYPDKSKVRAYYTSNLRNFSYQGGFWSGDKFQLNVSTLGTYTLLADTIPPTLRIINQNRSNITCIIDDALSGIESYEVMVDGEWVLMNYDAKNRRLSSEKLDPSKPFRGELVITVTDKVGNKKEYSTKIY